MLTAAVGIGSTILQKSLSMLPQSSADDLPNKGVRKAPASPATTGTTPVTTNPCGNGYQRIAVFDCSSDITGGPRNCYSAYLEGSLRGNFCYCDSNHSPQGVLCVTNYAPTAWFPIGINASTEYTPVYPVCYEFPTEPIGVLGSALTGVGVLGQSSSGPGVEAISCSSPVAMVKNNGGGSNKSAVVEFQNGCPTPTTWYEGVGGAGNSNGFTKGQFFILGNGQPRMVLNTCGKVGIGTSAPNSTLQINGGLSVAAAAKSANYSMGSSDFAIFANASSAAVRITLPQASNTGQVVHIKKIDSSTHVVTVARQGTDTIEGSTSKSLSTRYSSLTLIAGGNGLWYIVSNAT